MRVRGFLGVAIMAVGVMTVARTTEATPITNWQATGILQQVNLFGPNPAIGFSVGMPWSLTFTLNPATPGTPSCGTPPCPSYSYPAVGSTVLQLGPYTYTYTTGTAYTNSILPINVCCANPPGLVQFLWLGGGQGSPGSPNLNLIAPIFVAGYYDPKAISGALPAFPTISQTSTAFTGAYLLGTSGGNIPSTVLGLGAFQPAMIPEPGTWILVTGGVALAVARRCCRRRRVARSALYRVRRSLRVR